MLVAFLMYCCPQRSSSRMMGPSFHLLQALHGGLFLSSAGFASGGHMSFLLLTHEAPLQEFVAQVDGDRKRAHQRCDASCCRLVSRIQNSLRDHSSRCLRASCGVLSTQIDRTPW